ncbi:MAG TPA: MATE family efflux transporter [Candidatus Egerieimonas intestinavium]|uniref:Multidrug export protein MepA n=1 Tax=Candidatus Egerieimonas intestinavium TaxID=2840777 RepID=A0A9D1JEI5_9FIRM|nr:MATE family efflux transporter [Candidatus Egerieimonas intestinavium]
MAQQNDFSQGSVSGNIMSLAVPMTLAQLVNVLYSVVDRIYIGHLPHVSTQALTGIGLSLPVITAVTAFANLFGMGGAPLCSIARGAGQQERARKIMGNAFSCLLISGALLFALCFLFKEPLLYLFGASSDTFSYADDYLTVYLLGTLFVMVSLGMNNFINAQGFGKMGMATVLIGAVLNLILDPLFIFVFGMGVQGAAAATVISQGISALFVLKFLTGPRAIFRLERGALRLEGKLVREITGLGMSGFIMAITNSSVQVVCNATLARWGGDLYVGVMTVINSVREIINMPMTGLTNGAQPVIGFNYGAKKYGRVRKAIIFTTLSGVIMTTAVWALLFFFPHFFIHLFNSEPELLEAGVPAMRIYFFGIFMMSLQFAGQSTFVALGKSKQAIFFSLLRKAIIVIPLTLLLPMAAGLGVNGVFLAEPISNFLGGGACFGTMLLTVWPPLKTDSIGNIDRGKGL